MKRKLITALTGLTLIFIVLSCHKKTSEPAPVAPGCQLLSAKDTLGGDNYYTYNSENRLSQILYYDTIQHLLSIVTVLSYDGEGRVTKIAYGTSSSGKASEYVIFAYNTNNTLASDTDYSILSTNQTYPVCVGYNVYTYDNMNRVSEINSYTNLNMD